MKVTIAEKEYDLVFNPELNGASLINILEKTECEYIAEVEGNKELWYVVYDDETKKIQPKGFFIRKFPI